MHSNGDNGENDGHKNNSNNSTKLYNELAETKQHNNEFMFNLLKINI